MKQHSYTFGFAGAISLFCIAVTSPTQAQNVPVPDATLPVNSVVTSFDNISTITGGTIEGNNLFHSFEKFNIDEGQIADFVSPSGAIQNILARVTGSSSSKIMGTLSTSGLSNPNLFLINPNGIVFGPNATLEVGGSFVATTANAIEFGNQGFFSASIPNDPGLLTVNPSAFLFNQIAAQPINSIEIGNGAFISAGALEKPGSLLLVGGNVSPSIAETGKILIDGGSLQAPGGRIELGGVAGSGTVGLQVNGNNLRLSYPAKVQRADVSLTNGSFVNVVERGGGSIAISAQNLVILDGSQLAAGIGPGLESVDSKAGDITLDATGAIKIVESSIANELALRAVGNSGSILIKGESLYLTNSAELASRTFGQGNAGGIFVQGNKSVSIAGNSSIITSVAQMGGGNGGDINILAGDLFLTAGSLLESSTSGEGRAGNVIIDARDTVSVENSFISSETFGLKNAGIIDIKAKALSLTEGAELLSRTTGQGNAGNIQVNASDRVSISGVNLEDGSSSGLIAETLQEDSGLGGDISVTTGVLRVLDGAVLSARTLNASGGGDITVDVNKLEAINGGQLLTTAFSQGRAGNISVKASDSVTLTGSDPTYAARLEQFRRERVDPDSPASGLSARTEGSGGAGELRIQTGQLIVRDGAQVSASTSGIGQGGALTVTAPKSVTLSGGGSLSAQATADGNAGLLTINTLALTVQDGAEVSSSTRSGVGGDITLAGLNALQVSNGGNISASTATGQAGSLSVNANFDAAESVQLLGQDSGLFARATVGGDAGSLMINALALTVQNGAEVTVSSPQGRAGDMTVTADSILLDRGKLTAITGAGEGGNIGLSTQDLLLMRDHSLISASALSTANGGNINIDTDFIVAVPEENSDIIANAFEGNGGNIDITTQGIFGTQFREQRTPFSDITASSDFGVQGVVEINTPDIDPSRGLVNLPAELVDASNQIATGCTPGVRQGKSKFVTTGRGGLPPTPSVALTSDAIQVDWVTLNPSEENYSNPDVSTNATSATPAPLVEASGWVIGNDGKVILTASAPTATPHIPWLTPATCHTPETSS